MSKADNPTSKARAAYREHRWITHQRGLEFQFTFEEWVAWWEKHLGPDWHSKRGRRSDQYVMGRWYDDGPYAAHNVKCITAAENHRELWRRRYKLRNKKPTSIPWYQTDGK